MVKLPSALVIGKWFSKFSINKINSDLFSGSGIGQKSVFQLLLGQMARNYTIKYYFMQQG